jgi:hypothetical protein
VAGFCEEDNLGIHKRQGILLDQPRDIYVIKEVTFNGAIWKLYGLSDTFC